MSVKIAEMKDVAIPKGLEIVKDRPELLRLFHPDLTVRIDPKKTDCMHVTFAVKVTPPALAPHSAKARLVDVLVWDDQGTLPVMKSHPIPDGQTITDTVELPLPAGASVSGGYSRRFFVAVDPFDRISEYKEGNNRAEIMGTCPA